MRYSHSVFGFAVVRTKRIFVEIETAHIQYLAFGLDSISSTVDCLVLCVECVRFAHHSVE
jgi:hypothetical protein